MKSLSALPPLSGLLCLAAVVAVASTAACARRPESAVGGSALPIATSSGTGATAPTGTVTGAMAGTPEDFRQTVDDRVHFDLDSHELRADARSRLDAQAAWLRRYPDIRVRIEGNADERGTREYNLALGARRAEAVRDHLVAAGVSASRIEVISYGKERPIASGSTEAAHALNRNAHTDVSSGR